MTNTTTNTETMRLMICAITEERRRIADEAREFQKTVSHFATTNECVAYNQALREFADSIDHAATEAD